MRVNLVDTSSFAGKKFRLPVDKIDYSHPDMLNYGRVVQKVNMVKEYENPNAKELYRQAQRAADWKEKLRLYAEMGDFNLIDYGAGFRGYLRRIFDIRK